MTTLSPTLEQPPHRVMPLPAPTHADSYALLRAAPYGRSEALGAAHDFLDRQLDVAAAMGHDLPAHPSLLGQWATGRQAAVSAQYEAYLRERRDGGPRRYFGSKSHALYFIRNVGPTKLADGAWLYGTLAHWEDRDFQPLIKTYLEELGEGVPEKNHVSLYRRLLDRYGIAEATDLSDGHYTQAAIQLALGMSCERLLAEVVGYNLGYEQLPLHLLITSYELNELGIDPYYFTLHVTVDNASTGHAHDAIVALQRLAARARDPAEFYRRAGEGYKLNDLGECTTSVIRSFDMERELIRVLAAKAVVGSGMHSDFCRLAGRTINDWLSTPGQIEPMLRQFEQSGWIQHGQPRAESRFWRLVEGDRAEMFGVFSPYERQLLADWIETPLAPQSASAVPRARSFRAEQRSQGEAAAHSRPAVPRPFIRHAELAQSGEQQQSALRALELAVAAAPHKAGACALLIEHMSPLRHPTPAGLMATRMFTALYK